MRALNEREKRTIHIAAALLSIYLVLFYGLSGWRALEGKRAEHRGLIEKAAALKLEIQTEKVKGLRLKKLRETLALDPAKLKQAALVAEANAAIQGAAQAQGIQLGPSRETSGRSSQKELVEIQIEGQGSALGTAQFLHGIESLGFPLVIDGVQLRPVASKRGQVQMSVSVAVLNFAAWKSPEKSPEKGAEKSAEKSGG